MQPIPLEGPILLKPQITYGNCVPLRNSEQGSPFPFVILNIMCLMLNFKSIQVTLPSQDALTYSHSFEDKGRRELGCVLLALYPMKELSSNFLSTTFLQK